MIFAYLISIFTGIIWGVTESINKSITEKKYSVFAYSFLQNFLNFLIYLIPFIISISFKLPPFGTIYLYLFFTVMFLLVGNVLILKAYKTEDVSSVTILSKSNLVVTYFVGTIFLSEPSSVVKIIGIISIIIGIIIIFYEGKKINLNQGSVLALIAGILWGIRFYFLKVTLLSFDLIVYILLSQLLMSLAVIVIPSTIRDISPIFRKYKKKLLISRFTAVIGVYLLTWSIKHGNVSVVNTNIETFLLLSSVFIGIWVLGEKKNTGKKLAGSVLCILGIILLNFF